MADRQWPRPKSKFFPTSASTYSGLWGPSDTTSTGPWDQHPVLLPPNEEGTIPYQPNTAQLIPAPFTRAEDVLQLPRAPWALPPPSRILPLPSLGTTAPPMIRDHVAPASESGPSTSEVATQDLPLSRPELPPAAPTLPAPQPTASTVGTTSQTSDLVRSFEVFKDSASSNAPREDVSHPFLPGFLGFDPRVGQLGGSTTSPLHLSALAGAYRDPNTPVPHVSHDVPAVYGSSLWGVMSSPVIAAPVPKGPRSFMLAHSLTNAEFKANPSRAGPWSDEFPPGSCLGLPSPPPAERRDAAHVDHSMPYPSLVVPSSLPTTSKGAGVSNTGRVPSFGLDAFSTTAAFARAELSSVAAGGLLGPDPKLGQAIPRPVSPWRVPIGTGRPLPAGGVATGQLPRLSLLHPTVFGGPLERPWSRRYLELTASGCPMLMQALDPQNLPLMPMATMSAPVKWGVVKIINLPFTITKNEIYVFLGRHARVIEGPAISILMNRATAKTMETYVEFEMPSDAKHFVERYNDPKNKKRRRPSIGDRPVVMEVSSQEAFMAKLFPKAHCVSWTGQEPVVHPPADPSTAGFRGFLTKEEIVMTVKHAETPQRSPYVDKCPQRPYESFVSTLVKFPWWEDTLITLELRDQMFWAAERLTTILMNQMRKGVPGLEQGLLFELVGAVVKTPGFSEAQKYRVCVSAGMSGREFGLAPYAHAWPFATLTKKEETEPDVLKLYAALIREATVPFADQGNPEKDWSPFGNFVVPWPANAAQMTLREASILELNTFEYYLRQVLPQ